MTMILCGKPTLYQLYNISYIQINKSSIASILSERYKKRATKLIGQLKDKTYEERLRELGLPSLVYRGRRGHMILMFKMMNGLIRMDIRVLFSPTRLGHTRGHTQKVYKNHAVKAARVNSFSQSGQ